LRSETGQADCVTIDAEGLRKVMYCEELDGTTLIEGLAMVHGFTTHTGGGMTCGPFSYLTLRNCTFRSNTALSWGGGLNVIASSVTIENCAFEDNSAETGAGMNCCCGSSVTLTDCSFQSNSAEAGHGGGLNCEDTGTAVLEHCTFLGNYADDHGGGMSCGGDWSCTLTDCLFSGNEAGANGGAISITGLYQPSSATLTNCTLSHNRAAVNGGGMFCSDNSPSTLWRTIISFSTAGEAVYCGDAGSVPDLTCCDLYGNAGGDWVGCIINQGGINGNFSLDPLFCLDSNPDQPYSLHEDSPCLPNSSPCYYLVGALGLGCGPVSPVADVSWGSIKAVFR
jgi:predicted outer membrane repeat protein